MLKRIPTGIFQPSRPIGVKLGIQNVDAILLNWYKISENLCRESYPLLKVVEDSLSCFIHFMTNLFKFRHEDVQKKKSLLSNCESHSNQLSKNHLGLVNKF